VSLFSQCVTLNCSVILSPWWFEWPAPGVARSGFCGEGGRRGGLPPRSFSGLVAEGSWFGLGDAGGDQVAVVRHGDVAFEPFMDRDTRSRVTGPLRGGKQLQGAAFEAQGVVGGDGALVLEAEDVGELRSGWSGPVGNRRLSGGNGEPGVEPREEGVQGSVRVLEGAGIRQAQLGEQAVLKGAPKPLDPALRLGEWAKIRLMPSSSSARPTCVRGACPASASSTVASRGGLTTKMLCRSE